MQGNNIPVDQKIKFVESALMSKEYKPDKTGFSDSSFEEIRKSLNDLNGYSWPEQVRIFHYLNSVAYGYAGEMPPGIDKTIFSMGKLDNELFV